MFRRLLGALGFSSSSDPTAIASTPEELSASAIVAGTISGSHVLTIDGYSQSKELLITGKCATSRPFTVAGHRWVLKYFPNGEIPETSDSIAIYLKLDKHIKDVNARIKMSLLDKDGEPVPCYSCPKGSNPPVQVCTYSASQRARGTPGLISRKELEASEYLRDDCFRVRCDIVVLQEMRTEDRDAAAGSIDVPAPELCRHLGRLLSSGDGADVTFEVAGETFPAHRYIVVARSPVFVAELLGSMKEKHAARIRVEDMEARVFRALLHFIYTDSLPEIDDFIISTADSSPEIDEGDNMMVMAQHLLVAADRYGMERMRLVCEEKLRGYIDASTVGITLALAEQHGCQGLKKACLQFLMSRSNLKAAMATDGFSHLTKSCPYVVSELLSKVAF
ncbi:hypothetical protein PR202_gb13387 [Eleusine coracana subsp. coracana]|uniref:Uncharacterized protein n=1 Tax=Eleusine coracana subsp. coracana TaxID=191504 RepID=A0AAV5ETM3_ELECO|nr:hypothetical protein QOZ80_9BG0714390 [Eleusine coracana subsp. coracana]GJN25545.1 hypothetical protein PR202_gb13387 [Eleusine coracana subsp. coracana]